MLSRVADALFWMGRYLERASFLSRAVDVTFHLDLDLHGMVADTADSEWDRLLAMAQQPPPPAGETLRGGIPRWLLVDPANPGSVMACVSRARNNARMIRGSLTSQMWRELNKLFWHLSDPAFQGRVGESPHDFCQDVQVGVMLCHGICDSTFTHDEGWHFIQLGTSLERAEKVLRVLHSRLRAPSADDAGDPPDAALRWGAALKTCRAYEAYQRLFISRVEPQRVVPFLLHHADLPHSVRFCLGRVLHALEQISGSVPGRGDSEGMREVGRLASTLTYLDAATLEEGRLPVSLGEWLSSCSKVGVLVQQQYSLL